MSGLFFYGSTPLAGEADAFLGPVSTLDTRVLTLLQSSRMPSELTKRQKSILDAAIRAYVATAEPVASAEMVKKYRLPYSPATVRSELMALDEAGYLTQPHTSAGRIPTDKGYRLFINQRIAEPGAQNREEKRLREVADLAEPVEFAREAARLMAHLTGKFVLAGFPDNDLFFKSGMREVMREPEFTDTRAVQEFSALMETIEDEIGRWFDMEDLAEPMAFIGSENPIRLAQHCGMIVSSFETPFRRESVIALIGPKRMDYERDLALLRHFKQLLNA